MHPMLNIAIKAARTAGRIIVRFMDRLDEVEVSKKSRSDYVTQVDKLAEQEIITIIHQAYPEHSILAEESGESTQQSDFLWIIDPLDGTTNFIHGFPLFTVSIALKIKNKLEVGVVYDPISQELFTATRGKGAQLNNKRIRVSGCKNLEQSLLGTGFPVKHEQMLPSYLKTVESLLIASSGVRRTGSAALDLAYVAAGRLDGFWETTLKPWDIAAGILLITEAGGMISDLTGKMSMFETGNILAATPRLHQPMLELIKKSLNNE